MSISWPVKTLSIVTASGMVALGTPSGLPGPAAADPALASARATTPVLQRLRYLQTLPRHRSAAQTAADSRVRAAAGAPQYGISPIYANAFAVALSQTGRALLHADGNNGQTYNYVAFVNDSAPVLQLVQGCPPACDPLGGGPYPYYMSFFSALAIDNGVGSVVGFWGDQNSKDQGTVAYSNDYFIRWELHGRTASAITQIVPTISKKQLALYVGDGINDRGVSVGYRQSFGNPPTPGMGLSAVQFIGNNVTTLASLPGNTCGGDSASAINDAGTIVGSVATDCTSSTYDQRAARFSPNGPAALLPVRSPSAAAAINATGDVTGYWGVSSVGAPGAGMFLTGRAGTVYLPQLPAPPNFTFISASASAINDSDEVVGTDTYENANGTQSDTRALLYANGHAYDLNTLIPPNSGWQIVDAAGINDRGEILGDGYYNGTLMPFILKTL